MNATGSYSRDEFFRLMQAVEDQGGEHLDEQCKATTYEFSGERSKKVTLPSCGQSALFMVPVEPAENEMTGVMLPPPVKVCAVEDLVGLWPRFIDQVRG